MLFYDSAQKTENAWPMPDDDEHIKPFFNMWRQFSAFYSTGFKVELFYLRSKLVKIYRILSKKKCYKPLFAS